jgi:CDP-glucose 4,6-dehydratase
MEVLGMSVVISSKVDPNFWNGKRVFLTGHTGFKGGWLALWLLSMGAQVTGYSLAPETNPNFFEIVDLEEVLEKSYIADIRDLHQLRSAMGAANPEIVIHMAAQPLVRRSYSNPVETFSTNVMGTVHVLESIRQIGGVQASLVVSSDKCYENKEWVWGYRENEPMGGYDPYSSSKGCTELVTAAYRQSFFSDALYKKHGHALASARAGNVIGGGDWSEDRLIPDAIKSFESGEPLIIRNPTAIRPWQHVLEPLSGYLILIESLYIGGPKFAGPWNFGPRDQDARSVQEVIELLKGHFPKSASHLSGHGEQAYESHTLKLDCSKANQLLGWKPRWTLEDAISRTSDWYNNYSSKANMRNFSLIQIDAYQSTC